jgi:hypothetical protein
MIMPLTQNTNTIFTNQLLPNILSKRNVCAVDGNSRGFAREDIQDSVLEKSVSQPIPTQTLPCA